MTNIETTETPTERVNRVAGELGLSMVSVFIPWSQSRNKDEKETDYNGKPTKRPRRSLNWQVTLTKSGRAILTTDYSAGIAHCPSYKQGRMTVSDAEAVDFETEHGTRAHIMSGGRVTALSDRDKYRIVPQLADVLHSLVSDSDVLDSGTFEDWARELGYDTDSRKAEATYRACLEIALKLRNGLGESGLAKLREATQDY